jgi:PAS domain S-box-containing protein
MGKMVNIITKGKVENQQSIAISDKFFMHSIDLLCIADNNGNFIKINTAWNKTLGYEIAEIEGKPYLNFVHPDDIANTLEIEKVISNNKEIHNFVNRVKHKDGTYRFIEWSASSKEDSYYASGRDITTRMQSDKDFIYNNKLLYSVLDSITIGLLYSKNDRFEWGNSTFLKMVNSGLEEIKGKHLSLFLKNPKDFESIHLEALACFANGNVYNREIDVSNEGTSIDWINLTGKALTFERPEEGVVWMIQDITERQQAKEALIVNEERSRLFIENTPLPIAMFDKNMCYMAASKRWSIDYNLGNQELIGRSHYEVFPEITDRWKDDHQRVLKGEIYKNESDRFERLDGTDQWLRYELHPWYKSRGQIGGLVMFTEDITENKKAENILNQTIKEYSQLNKELTDSLERIEQINLELGKAKQKAEESDNLKTAFLANLSHEIRTPMNGILGFAGLLKNEDITQDKRERFVRLIEQSSKRMLKLISDLVDISKIESNQVDIRPKRSNLNSLMDKTYNFFKPLSEIKRIELTYSKGLSNGESEIIIDNLKLEQILSNLINNALKFTKEGSIYFNYTLHDGWLTFKVKDTGIGIPAGMEQLIFERFRQAENNHLVGNEGSGLGLSISKAFIELMGGSIWVESEKGKGSVFVFTLPYTPAEKVIQIKPTISEPLFDKGITLLIAEDDTMSYLYLEELLLDNKFTIIHAENGREAVQLTNEHPEIEIILMDLKMPIMDGIEATSEIRKNNTKVPIIAQTAYTSENDKNQALIAGCNDYITKPINKETLLEKMDYLLSIQKIDLRNS